MSSFLVIAFTTLLTTVNPIESLGPFLSLTAGQTHDYRKRVAWRATLVSGLILVVAAACGAVVFQVFGITLPAFRIAGGILLFSVGVKMLNDKGEATTAEETSGDGEDIAIFPLAIPLIAGPGAIASILILAERAKGIVEISSLYVALAATQAVLYFVLFKAEKVSSLLGPLALKVVTRLMGLILSALATQFVIDGIRDALPGLA